MSVILLTNKFVLEEHLLWIIIFSWFINMMKFTRFLVVLLFMVMEVTGWGWSSMTPRALHSLSMATDFDSLSGKIADKGNQILMESKNTAKVVSSVLTEVRSLPANPETVGYLCKRITSENDSIKLKILKSKRYSSLAEILKRDRDLYKQTVLLFSSEIPRSELPNLQDIPYYNATYMTPTSSQMSVGDLAYQKSLLDANMVESSSVANLTFSDSPLDSFLLAIFRSMVQKEVKYVSPIHGIRGLLDEGRTYMLSDDGTDENQHRMVRTVLGGLLTPFLPPFYRIFMAGIVPCKENGDPEWLIHAFAAVNKALVGQGGSLETGPLAPGKAMFGGPLIYAPFLTSVVTPPFLKFLVGPSRTNYRKDGQLGGIVVEKCKFLQESGCKGLCLHQCKLPAQQFFADKLKLPLTVEPNFATQECQWSWGLEPMVPEQDPAWPKGCLVDCPTRSMTKRSSS